MINLYPTAGRSHDLSFAYSWNMLQSTMLKIHFIVPKFPKILLRNIRILVMHEIIFTKEKYFAPNSKCIHMLNRIVGLTFKHLKNMMDPYQKAGKS